MLKPKVLSEVLKQINTGGIHSTLLLNNEGALLAHTGEADKNSFMISALVSNIWNLYEKLGHDTELNDTLEAVSIECMNGMVFVKKINKLLLCIYTEKYDEINMGMIMIKIETLSKYLSPHLNKILL
ncbi:unnamed protein product [Gordionus sp. m RMFG-2023]